MEYINSKEVTEYELHNLVEVNDFLKNFSPYNNYRIVGWYEDGQYRLRLLDLEKLICYKIDDYNVDYRIEKILNNICINDMINNINDIDYELKAVDIKLDEDKYSNNEYFYGYNSKKQDFMNGEFIIEGNTLKFDLVDKKVDELFVIDCSDIVLNNAVEVFNYCCLAAYIIHDPSFMMFESGHYFVGGPKYDDDVQFARLYTKDITKVFEFYSDYLRHDCIDKNYGYKLWNVECDYKSKVTDTLIGTYNLREYKIQGILNDIKVPFGYYFDEDEGEHSIYFYDTGESVFETTDFEAFIDKVSKLFNIEIISNFDKPVIRTLKELNERIDFICGYTGFYSNTYDFIKNKISLNKSHPDKSTVEFICNLYGDYDDEDYYDDYNEKDIFDSASKAFDIIRERITDSLLDYPDDSRRGLYYNSEDDYMLDYCCYADLFDAYDIDDEAIREDILYNNGLLGVKTESDMYLEQIKKLQDVGNKASDIIEKLVNENDKAEQAIDKLKKDKEKALDVIKKLRDCNDLLTKEVEDLKKQVATLKAPKPAPVQATPVKNTSSKDLTIEDMRAAFRLTLYDMYKNKFVGRRKNSSGGVELYLKKAVPDEVLEMYLDYCKKKHKKIAGTVIVKDSKGFLRMTPEATKTLLNFLMKHKVW